MAQFDMAAKRAIRLLGKNWQKVCQEAHGIGSLGLPICVTVAEEKVRLCLYPETLNRGMIVTIYSTGEIFGESLIQCQNHTWTTDYSTYRNGADAIAEILRMTLEEQENRAKRMGEAVKALAGAKKD